MKIQFSFLNDPTNFQSDSFLFDCATPEDALKASDLFNKLSVDAERYRYLRDSDNRGDVVFIAIRSPSHIVGQLKGAYADQYIDSAMQSASTSKTDHS